MCDLTNHVLSSYHQDMTNPRQRISLPALNKRLRTEADAYLYLEELVWGDRPACPHCGSMGKHYFLNPANGESRKTRTGSVSQRRVWKCAEKPCRRQFSVLTGTVMHGSKIEIKTWLMVIYEICASKNGVSAREIQRKYELTPKTAWFMLHRLREAMTSDAVLSKFSGTVIADESWVGGESRRVYGTLQGERHARAALPRSRSSSRSSTRPRAKRAPRSSPTSPPTPSPRPSWSM